MNKINGHSVHAADHALTQPAAHRRHILRWLSAGAVASAAPLALLTCGGGEETGTSASITSSTSITCAAMPSETAGPYPCNGTTSNRRGVVNVLTLPGTVRSDIRSSVGGLSGTAAGVPLTVTLALANTAASCASLAGFAVYLWHCTREGEYSLYGRDALNQNYLRGVQLTDSSGEAGFSTIFPGCYSGRWPHIHFQVYPSLAVATSGSADAKTSQLALPAAACKQVYGVASGYSASVANFAAATLASNSVFGDDSATTQLATVTGDATHGFAATLTIGIPT
ncbi:hypothetical protein BH10PSE16_BH10PSE16_40430 [soil metagenome]